ncbi:AAA family ATPase [uncultured Pseudoteredinibacter sp.]|uniref:AAA family ATPase n=1 Tax=uncultured Pseudoteredinibacter sp. TaxID=1641701 RepID=UPI002612B444|nr:AAA family ATPase [uncultured Pseudoteredinibacter sp.]
MNSQQEFQLDNLTPLYTSQRTRISKAQDRLSGESLVVKQSISLDLDFSRYGECKEWVLGRSLDPSYVSCPIAIMQFERRPALIFAEEGLRSLADLAPAGGMDLHSWLDLGIEICRCIESIHNAGVIHRDINPANIVSSTDFRSVKLIDFEHASSLQEHSAEFTSAKQLAGTLAYISPEQTGRVNLPIDQRSDLYSLGCTLFYLATGQTLYQAKEPAELIYAHIAQAPTALDSVLPRWPKVVARVVDRLLKKDPKLRYQSIAALQQDLEHIRQCLGQDKTLENFKVGLGDSNTAIQLSQKLFGREQQKAELLKSLKEARDQVCILSVCGPSGIGKSALIRELFAEISRSNGFYISGKFDQFEKGHAYTAICSALDDFIDQALADDNVPWSEVISKSAASALPLLLEMMPKFSLLLAEQASTEGQFSKHEVRTQRNRLFAELFFTICEQLHRQGRELVMFIDDLQWADAASIELMEKILQRKPNGLLILLSYRDDEIEDSYHSSLFLKTIEDLDCRFKKLLLPTLKQEHLIDWLQVDLHLDRNVAAKLAEQLMLRTAGNPYHIRSLLESILSSEIVFVEGAKVKIDWDAMLALPILSSTEYVKDKLQGLNEESKDLVAKLSILGNKFSISQMCDFLDVKRFELAEKIRDLIKISALFKAGDYIHFCHDSVQRAAFDLLPENQVQSLCLSLADKLRDRQINQGGQPDYAQFLHLYNRAIKLLDKNQLEDLVRMNLEYSRELMAQAAFASALDFLSVSEQILLEKHAGRYSDRLGEVCTAMGEANIGLCNFDEGLEKLDWVIAKARKDKEKIPALVSKLNYYSAGHLNSEAAGVLKELLRAMHIGMPKRVGLLRQVASFFKLISHSSVRHPEKILELPELEDEEVKQQIKLLSACLVAAYLCESDYFGLIVMHMIKLTLKHGVFDQSASPMICFSVVCMAFGRWDLARNFAKSALALLDRYDNKSTEAFVYLNYGALVNHWFNRPIAENESYVKMALDSAEACGEYEVASLGIAILTGQRYLRGIPLPSLIEIQLKARDYIEQFEKDLSLQHSDFTIELFRAVSLSDSDGVTISGPFFNEEDMLSLEADQGESIFVSGLYADKAFLCVLQKDYSLAFDNFSRAFNGKIMEAAGSYYHPFIFMVGVVASVNCLSQNYQPLKARYYIWTLLRRLRKLSEQSPVNFKPQYLLAKACYLAYKGSFEEGMSAYQEALDCVIKDGALQTKALAHELFARFLLTKNFTGLANTQIRLAYEFYQQWGAQPKLRVMREEFAFLQDRYAASDSTLSTTTRTVNADLDFKALSRSIELLGSSLDKNQLLSGLMDALLLNSGASRVAYVEHFNGSLSLLALKSGDSACLILEEGEAKLHEHQLQLSLLHKAKDGKGKVLLENCELNGASLSVLVIPIYRKAALQGLIYLENSLFADAFRPDNVDVLRLLAMQAGMALENAGVFEHAERERKNVENIINAAPLLVFEVSVDARILYVNPEACRLTGYSKDEMIDANWWHLLLHEENSANFKDVRRAVIKGELNNFEFSIQTKNNEERIVLWSNVIRQAEKGRRRILIFGVDATEEIVAKRKMLGFNQELQERVASRTHDLEVSLQSLKEAQSKLVESEKAAALSGLVAGVAHEINTPIGIGVTGATQFIDSTKRIVRDYESGAMSQQGLEGYFKNSMSIAELLHSNLHRAAELVKSFKQISVDQTSEARRRFYLTEYLQEALLSLHSQYAHRDITVDLQGPELFEIDSYPGFYSQVLTNLLMNSLSHAYGEEDSGQITIRVTIDDSEISINYCDDGKGISDDNLSKIFDPFFTTNSQGGGTGLGLNILYNLITQNLNGEIRCESDLGAGVCFYIKLPRELAKEEISL